MPIPSLVQRLKERKLGQWAVAYLAGAFVVFQVMDALAEPLSLSILAQRAILVLVGVGFLLTLVLAWYHGEKGRQRVSGPELLMVAVLLVIAGALLSVLPGGDEVAEAAGPSELARFAALNMDLPTIAVLPLANLSADEENAYFAAGIHEELLRLLSLVRELGVISRTSVLQYADVSMNAREIAAELGARYIVEGSVQEAHGRVRIQVQLIDGETDQHLWGERYDEELEDIFALQSDVAQAIAGELQAVVSPDELGRIEAPPTQDPIAYDLYLRALDLSYYDRERWEARVDLLRRAASRDTAFALAHASLAGAFIVGAIAHEIPAGYDSALARAEIAIRLDPDLPQGHGRRAWILGDRGHREEAEASLQRALSINPSYGYAWGTLAAIGWWYEDYVQGALAGRQGAKVDPRDTNTLLHLSNCLVYVGMYREAELWYGRIIDLDPDNIWGLFGLAAAAWTTGDETRARTHIARMREAGADNPNVLAYAGFLQIALGDLEAAAEALGAIDPSSLTVSTNAFPTAEALLGWVEVQTGRPGGRERLENLQRRRLEQVAAERVSLTGINDLSVITSLLGEEEEQLRWFREAVRWRWGTNYVFRSAPWYDGIRDHPDFQTWLRDAEQRMAEHQRELAAMGPWMPEEVLGVGNR